MDPVIVPVASVLSALVGAFANNLYRDHRDRPVLQAFAEDFGIVRRPIALPDKISKELKTQGNFKEWAQPRVRWDIQKKISDNTFGIRDLHELHHLVPAFLKVLESHQGVLVEQASLLSSGDERKISRAFSLLRHSWQKNFGEDIAIAYNKDPAETIRKAKSNNDGDLSQLKSAIDGLTIIVEYLNDGLSPDAPSAKRILATPEEPTNPRLPFIIVDVMVMNTGKTETLIQGGATLVIGNREFPLEGVTESRDFNVFTGKYWKIERNTVVQTSFSQSPNKTNLSDLKELSELIKDRRHIARIELRDFSGDVIKSRDFKLRDEQT